MIGRTIENFQIIQLLGIGGMGTVYKAKDLTLNRFVAIKVLNANLVHNANNYKRFRKEAEVSAQINHPNVATLHNYLELENQSFIIMEYVDGITLEELLDHKGTLSRQETLEITTQILKGLSAAHKKGIFHRDLKPANIMISESGVVKIMDFGISLMENSTRLTTHNKVIGTVHYMAPELLTGASPSQSSDLYAVGIVMNEMLTGKILFHADSEPALMYKIVHEKPPLEYKTSQRDLKLFIAKLLQKNPSKRPRDTKSALENLTKITELKNGFGPKSNLLPYPFLEKIKGRLNNLYAAKIRSGLNGPVTHLKNLSFTKLINTRFVLACFVATSLIILIVQFRFDSKEAQVTSELTSDLEEKSIIPQEEPQKKLQTFSPQKNTEEVRNSYEAIVQELKNNPKEKPSFQTPKKATKEVTQKVKESSKAEDSENLSEVISDPSLTSKDSENNEEIENKKIVSNDVLIEMESPNVISPENKRDEEKSSLDMFEASKPKQILTLDLPSQYISVVFPEDISSQDYEIGDAFFLKTNRAVKVDNHVVITNGAAVKASVKRKKASRNGKLKFGFEILAVQDINGDWLEVKYPEYTDINTGNIVFQKGRTINKILLTPKKISIEI